MLSNANGLSPFAVGMLVMGPLADHSTFASVVVSMRDGGFTARDKRLSSVSNFALPPNDLLVTPGSSFSDAQFIGRPDPTTHRSSATSSPRPYCIRCGTRRLVRPMADSSANARVKIAYVYSG